MGGRRAEASRPRDLQPPPSALSSLDPVQQVQALMAAGGGALQRADPTAACAIFEAALSLQPNLAEAHYGRGAALLALGRPDAAIGAFDQALALRPDHVAIRLDRGVAYRALGRSDEALADFDAASRVDPTNVAAWFNRGAVLKDIRRLDEALESYDRALSLKPDFALAHNNRADLVLMKGDWPAGLREYEWRRQAPGFADGLARDLPEWTGDEDLAGLSLLIYPELFQGDLIQFSRYARVARSRGARVILGAPIPLHALLRTLSPNIELVAPEAKVEADRQCALMSLPLAFGTTPQTVPADTPYLWAEPDRIVRWRSAIGDGGFRIGVCWQGSAAAYAAALQRSFPLAALKPIAEQQGVRLISIQKVNGLDQLETLPAGMTVETLGEDFDPGPDLFLDTAAAMMACDLVITPDTSVAHLAGALGVSTWLALPSVADWRWMTERRDSPWYPTMRLFRQPVAGDWTSVFAAMAAELEEERAARI